MNATYKIITRNLGFANLIRYAFGGLVIGLLNFGFIILTVNTIALIVSGVYKSFSIKYALEFCLIISLFVCIRLLLTKSLIRFSQTLSWKLRKNIIQTVLDSNYSVILERKSEIRTSLMYDITIINEASLGLIEFLSALILAIGCLGYLLYLSHLIFLITAMITILGIILYYFSTVKNTLEFKKSHVQEGKFFTGLNDILLGLKEIYMSQKKRTDIFENKINKVSKFAIEINSRAYGRLLNNAIIGQVSLYSLIAFILLFLSISGNFKPAILINSVFTLIYLLGALQSIINLIPGISRAKASAENIIELESYLRQHTRIHESSDPPIMGHFSSLSTHQLTFNYGDTTSFQIGPIDLKILKGEVLFIYGGNGSGKTTLIQTILGFFKPSSGDIRINGLRINNELDCYKSFYSVVFSDFYLFDYLIANESPDLDLWNYYADLFGIGDKLSLEGNNYSTLELSTGQRKRVALITVLMEKKPILVLDEWAADQDPDFRAKFYIEILPILKKEGRTIIAITHDDKYYSSADSLYKMENGQLYLQNAKVS